MFWLSNCQNIFVIYQYQNINQITFYNYNQSTCKTYLVVPALFPIIKLERNLISIQRNSGGKKHPFRRDKTWIVIVVVTVIVVVGVVVIVYIII